MAWEELDPPTAPGPDEAIEIVGTHLRLTGYVSLGRFTRLTDLVNAQTGYLRVRDARLLQRNGEPTSLLLSEIMVDQDEISFIAQTVAPREPGTGAAFDSGFREAGLERLARPYILFTPGHTLTGRVHVFGQTDLASFVDSTDPRYVPVVDVTTRSLADRRIVTRYDFVLINRTQMIAAAEADRSGDAPEAPVADDDAQVDDRAADQTAL
jgi:hypothetical protein